MEPEPEYAGTPDPVSSKASKVLLFYSAIIAKSKPM